MATENPIIYSESILSLAAKYDMAVDKVYDILNLRSLGLESSVIHGAILEEFNDNNSQYKKVA